MKIVGSFVLFLVVSAILVALIVAEVIINLRRERENE